MVVLAGVIPGEMQIVIHKNEMLVPTIIVYMDGKINSHPPSEYDTWHIQHQNTVQF